MRGSLKVDVLHATMHIAPKIHDVHKLPKYLASLTPSIETNLLRLPYQHVLNVHMSLGYSQGHV